MQQQMNTQQPSAMPQPPQIISTKDALYFTDMLSWNLLAMKKAHFFASQCQDKEVSAAIEKAGQMHQRHYQQILSHLQNTDRPKTPMQ
ncbi:hypothetical protein [Parageobacillus thermoglucosidasius]|uniref:hypothetical protein n=1 Tax=Parageobacillus thermoglucosidasius TaxID=1426 RepID=UPI000B558FC9|nr:hypothetical protein [Parageobacillus thermoglucosidasius]MBY6266800.1 hypothetical protein [Parageobacillus thermoglucosidasius]MED4905297.1 hypothetical protein [Parageobacillus thermoglucosidasius]MED4914212.1 hypothetical protein [Parageobacillus thermoglucosidasius]MED4945584.1 hypothetical protein [Parageobacillus thermoglucosidasius]MED4981423.1 hypothetical protein [Parageobacillus thermoglucosidasius]